MPREVIIRKADVEDVPSIIELWKELMDFHKERDEFFSRSADGNKNFEDFITGHISKDTSCVFVAEADENIVGYCLAVIEKHPPVLEIQEYGKIANIAVTENYRKREIGRRLLRETINCFSERNIHRIEACFSTSNEMAKKFWNKVGFTAYLETAFMEI